MSTTRSLVIGNWKMNLDFVEAVHLGQQIGVILKNRPAEHTDIVVAPPFVDLRSVMSIVDSERINIDVGAQHVSANDNGAFTGEISTSMLKRLNVSWVLVGHSERRSLFGMDDAVVAATLRAVVHSGLNAVLCVGENVDVRDAEGQNEFVGAQLKSALEGLDDKYFDQVTVAYEPIWAIGTGRTANGQQIAAMTTFIRSVLHNGEMTANRVLYGGSVNAENAASILVEGSVDGFLVGGASLSAEGFLAIVQACDDCYAGKR
jgi:triosephosphate isomerase (TIM)